MRLWNDTKSVLKSCDMFSLMKPQNERTDLIPHQSRMKKNTQEVFSKCRANKTVKDLLFFSLTQQLLPVSTLGGVID